MSKRMIFAWFLCCAAVSMSVHAQVVGHVRMSNLQGAMDNYNAQVRAENQSDRARVNRNLQAIDRGISTLNRGMNMLETIRNFGESGFGPLVPDDIDFDPDFEPAGAPTIPVHCEVSGGNECRACYDDAYRKLNFVRHYLEVLRGIYGRTQRYTRHMIAFGDSMAGLHGGFGLGWPPERKGIQDAFDDMGDTYDEKYEGYMRELQEGLQELASCEKQYFEEDDWYSRYGFIYYTYMQDRYRR
jgi:hypothetical protein